MHVFEIHARLYKMGEVDSVLERQILRILQRLGNNQTLLRIGATERHCHPFS